VKLGANADTLTSSATGDIESLTKKDIIVFGEALTTLGKIIPEIVK
jgi:hypothetical protein